MNSLHTVPVCIKRAKIEKVYVGNRLKVAQYKDFLTSNLQPLKCCNFLKNAYKLLKEVYIDR